VEPSDPAKNSGGKKRLKVTIISMNLSTNCTNRCLRLAQALSSKYDVEIVGTTFGIGKRWGEGMWPPLESIAMPLRSVKGDYLPGYIKSIRMLLSYIDGDVIIACKPRFPSFGIALIKKLVACKPVILDIDDDELAQTMPGRSAALIKKLINTSGYLYTRITHRLCRYADCVFTVSEHFRNIYGGVIVPHGQHPLELDPSKYDRTKIRAELNINDHEIIIGFIGSPQYQKGIDLILEALARIGNVAIKLMIVGAATDDAYIKSLNEKYAASLILIAPQPLEKLPYFLAAADLIALPQRDVPESLGQMPAKLTDAMAMAKPVIASALADIPYYLQGRGLVVEPGNVDQLKAGIEWIVLHPQEAIQLGQKGREFFLDKLTLNAMLAAMDPEIQRLVNKPK
jgi:glycosyltransferase involved in cell wall biosynthesis